MFEVDVCPLNDAAFIEDLDNLDLPDEIKYEIIATGLAYYDHDDESYELYLVDKLPYVLINFDNFLDKFTVMNRITMKPDHCTRDELLKLGYPESVLRYITYKEER